MKKYLLGLLVSVLLSLPSTHLVAQMQNGAAERLIHIETSMGNMVIKLYNETPGHRDNMLKLIEEGFYKEHLFHRVIKDFMIQGGDPHSVGAKKGQRLGTGGPGYDIPAEFHGELFHKKGALAAAREGDQMNPEQKSSGSQFYIVQGRVFTIEELNIMAKRGMITLSEKQIEAYTTIGGTPHLDGAYTVFGEVVEGMEILDAIGSTKTDSYDRPVKDVVYSISLIK